MSYKGILAYLIIYTQGWLYFLCFLNLHNHNYFQERSHGICVQSTSFGSSMLMENNTNKEQIFWILSLRSSIISAESKCKCWDYATFCRYLLSLPSQYPSLFLEIIPWFSFGSHLYPLNQSTWFRHGWSYPWLQEWSHEWAQQINVFCPTEHSLLDLHDISLKLLCTPIDKAGLKKKPIQESRATRQSPHESIWVIEWRRWLDFFQLYLPFFLFT